MKARSCLRSNTTRSGSHGLSLVRDGDSADNGGVGLAVAAAAVIDPTRAGASLTGRIAGPG